MSRRMVVLYCVCTLLLSWAVQLAGLYAVLDPSSPDAAPWHMAAMAVPGVVALAFLALHPSELAGSARPAGTRRPTSLAGVDPVGPVAIA